MPRARIKDIYAGMPDAKDEFYTGQEDNFYATFLLPQNFLSITYSTAKNF